MVSMLPMFNICPMFMNLNPKMVRALPRILPDSQVPISETLLATTDERKLSMRRRVHFNTRDQTHDDHVPFDWYKPPEEHYNIIHEDIAVVTAHGSVPIKKFYKYYDIDCRSMSKCKQRKMNNRSRHVRLELDSDKRRQAYNKSSLFNLPMLTKTSYPDCHLDRSLLISRLNNKRPTKSILKKRQLM